ncbi:RNA 2',3'-cyclic phosphodiesterase [Nanoarchaeota archaeon]
MLKNVEFPKFTLTLDTIGVFPSPSRINVVWIDVKEKQMVNELQKSIDDYMLNLGFENETKFYPHITVARVKFLINKREFKDKIDNIKIQPLKFEINSFKLYKSTLTQEGPIYEVVEEFKLIN